MVNSGGSAPGFSFAKNGAMRIASLSQSDGGFAPKLEIDPDIPLAIEKKNFYFSKNVLYYVPLYGFAKN